MARRPHSAFLRRTQSRVLHAAALYGYTANAVARSLRQKRTFTIGVIIPEISEGYSTAVLSGIEDELSKDGFFYIVVSHRHRPELLEGYPRMLVSRSVEGIIAVDSAIDCELPVPVVSVSGHQPRDGVINIELNHDTAAELALSHLRSLGHANIAFIKGQPFSSDTNCRWQSIVDAAKKLDIQIDPRLVIQLQSTEPGPVPGAEITRTLIQTGLPFTAIFAFNDLSAMGAILALREAGTFRSQGCLGARLRRRARGVNKQPSSNHHPSALARDGPRGCEHPSRAHSGRYSQATS